MHTDIWDKTYLELKDKLNREPTIREVQREMLKKMFGEKKTT